LPSLIAHALQNGLTIVSVLNMTARGDDLREPLSVLAVSPNWSAAGMGMVVWLAMVLILMRCLPKTR
jgi:hypothetical protein